MMNAVALTMAAASNDSINAAIVAASHDREGSTGICVGMDTSAASPDHRTFAISS
jgi:hypothetical protein